MPTLRKQITTAIKGILEDISGVGVVQEYYRYTRTPEGFREYFTELVDQYTRTANVWLITRDGFTQTADGVPIPEEIREHLFTISGYVGLKDADASEETFQDLVDEVVSALESRKRFGLEATNIHVRAQKTVIIDHAWLGRTVLCHHCEIQLRVLGRRTIAYVA